MADENNLPGPNDGSGGQDVCSLFASIFTQRQQMERLLSWLRQSQTTCTDTHCFDDISRLPETEHDSVLLEGAPAPYNVDTGATAFILWLVVALLTLYALTLNRGRENEVATKGRQGNSRGFHDDQDRHDRRNGDNDDPNRSSGI